MTSFHTSRKFVAAAALASVSIAGLADLAAAETPAQQSGGVLVAQPETDPQPPTNPDGPIVIAQPETGPEPHPQPDPGPQADLPIAQPETPPGPDTIPQPDLPIANPTEDPDPDPDPTGGIDDFQVDPCTVVTHGCGDEPIDDFTAGEGTPDGHCLNDAGEVVDVAECLPDEDGDDPIETPETPEETDEPTDSGEPKGQDRGALPRTGAGLALLAGLGGTLTAAGAAARRLARR